MVERLFLAVPQGCLQFVIVVFPDLTHLLLLKHLSNQTVLLVNKCKVNMQYLFFKCNQYSKANAAFKENPMEENMCFVFF